MKRSMKSRFRFLCLLLGLLVAFLLIYEGDQKLLHFSEISRPLHISEESIGTKITGQVSAVAVEFLTERFNGQ